MPHQPVLGTLTCECSTGLATTLYSMTLRSKRRPSSRYAANKYYQEAIKAGLEESLLSLSSPEQQQQMAVMGQVDEKSDGIVIINSAGVCRALF